MVTHAMVVLPFSLTFALISWLVGEPLRALALVEREMSGRRDIYTYDALAWALYKNKKYEEAGKAKEKALELGTSEPAFYYHAGMIERALGQTDQARGHLQKALALNARFDPRQASLAEAALKEIAQ